MANNVTIMGRLARDVEVKMITTAKGDSLAVVNNSIAVQRNKEEVDFIPFSAFGKTAELIGQYTEKGGRLLLNGRLRTRNYETAEGEKRWTMEVNAYNIDIIDFKADEEGVAPTAPTAPTAKTAPKKAADDLDVSEDFFNGDVDIDSLFK